MNEQIAETESKRKILEKLIYTLYGVNGGRASLMKICGGLLDYICVKKDGAIIVIFKGGIEIAAEGGISQR